MKVAQSCLTLCNPMNSIVYGILQARILEWVAFPYSRGFSQPRDQTQVSIIASWFFTSWATRESQEYWSRLSLLQWIFPTQELNGVSCIAGGFFTTELSAAADAAKSLHSCPTLCDPIDGSPPGPAIPGILQARTLDWVATELSGKPKTWSYSLAK